MPHRIINSPAELAELATLLGGLTLPLTVQWARGRNRSLSQNDTMWMWAMEVARQRGDVTPDEVQREWKLIYGIPILREDEDFRAFYDQSLKGLPYENKLEAMQYLPVSSIMKVGQMSEMMNTIQREMLTKGFRLTDPERRDAA